MDTETIGTKSIETNPAQFEYLFKTHFNSLHRYAYMVVKDNDAAEEIVQQVFYRLWEKRKRFKDNTSYTSYLYRSVYNESLNFLKHIKVRMAYTKHMHHNGDKHGMPAHEGLKQLEEKIHLALNELPQQCRTIFQLSRFEELKYQAIAEKLGISVKTVESQMGKALRILRIKLADYLPMLVLIIANLQN